MYVDGHEVWHGVAFLYRDTDWGTPEPVVDAVHPTIRPDSFTVTLQAHVPVQPSIDLSITIDGDSTGRVRYVATMTARGDIATNRTGVCVMHPMSAMEHAVSIEHVDGRISRSSFPKFIPPWPPFTLIRAIGHEFATGAWAECRFEGEVFEFEDQRNNADASFKTYSRSNSMPRPYMLRAGVPARQAVELRLQSLPANGRHWPKPVGLTVSPARHPLTRVGIGLLPRDLRQVERLLPWLHELAPAQLHLVIDTADTPIDTHGLSRLLKATGASLRLDISSVASDGASLEALGAALCEARIKPESVGVFPSSEQVVAAARRAFVGAAVGGGTPHFFAQVNRIEDIGDVDFLSFTTSSVVHMADDESVMTGLQSLPWLVETLRATHPGRRVRVGPCGIAARSSPLGKQPDSDGTRRLTLARLDPRSGALFGAAWVVGLLASFTHAGIDAVSVLGLGSGEGLVVAQGDRLHLSPAGWVLRELRGALHLRPISISQENSLAALAWDHKDGSTLLIANLSENVTRVAISGWITSTVKVMDAASWMSRSADGQTYPWRSVDGSSSGLLELPAYAVATLRAVTVSGD